MLLRMLYVMYSMHGLRPFFYIFSYVPVCCLSLFQNTNEQSHETSCMDSNCWAYFIRWVCLKLGIIERQIYYAYRVVVNALKCRTIRWLCTCVRSGMTNDSLTRHTIAGWQLKALLEFWQLWRKFNSIFYSYNFSRRSLLLRNVLNFWR